MAKMIIIFTTIIVINAALAPLNAKSLDEGTNSTLCGIDHFVEIVNDTVVCSPCPVDSHINVSQHNLTECSRRERKVDLSEYWNFQASQVHPLFFIIGIMLATITVIVLAFIFCGWQIFCLNDDPHVFTILANAIAIMRKQLKKFANILKNPNNATLKKKDNSQNVSSTDELHTNLI
ncbi:hypothetical protein Bpfe_005330 [Biomphalaria pfeifferi]|uniref:Uncharacterized protein n=1 Tax=Biomphalaria pfeifferi TaxID=112525 RepID=A0AAD8C4H1_BIOPF|nr:hypothetical protein Bpfe_005330 [Biomphalaria pfeifferi]